MSQVLIADDSPFMRRVLKEILNEGGYTVVSECQNGLEAVEKYKAEKPDLVLMDYNMPKMNGVDSARTILKHDPKACIVMVTAVVGKKKIIDALRLGVKNYITKPFDNSALLRILSKVMGEKTPFKSTALFANKEDNNGEFPVTGSFFGQYLLQKGIITKELLVKALEIQSDVNKKIGELAIREGFLLKEHVDTVLKVQKRINKHFGQLAIQMGLLTHEHVTHLRNIQQSNYIELDDIMARENMLPREILKKELELFKTLDEGDQGVFNMSWVSRHIKDGFIYETFIEQTLKLIMRLAGIFVMEGECTFERRTFKGHGVVIKISISGDSFWSYYLNLSENLAAQIAGAMLEIEEGAENEDLSVEAANEFANIACGNAVGKLDGRGIKFEISPPSTQRMSSTETFSFKEEEQVLCVPILVPEGDMELVIAGMDIFLPTETAQ